MKIGSVNYNYFTALNNNNKLKNKTSAEIETKDNVSFPKPLMPTTAQYLAFCGGKSLNLSDTVTQIDKFGNFPPDIRESALEIIKAGNPDNKTLIDVHKAKYADLYACDSIEEVREFFPEFKDVLSDKEVLYKENSFIDEVKKGEIEYFDKDEDVALQLLQMYWGEGISLNEFKDEFAGKNIYRAFEKLNIPRLDKVYGHYLSFSDKSKNDKFVEALKKRALNKQVRSEEKSSETTAEKKTLSPEHRAKISEGLKKYYSENPQMAYQLSESHKKYFEENPEQKEIFSQVLLRAWKYPETKSIRKALAKHLKLKDLTPEEIVKLPSNAVSSDLKSFWSKNEWARKNFSASMTKSWARQKELSENGLIYEPIATVELLSPELKKQIAKIDDKHNFSEKYVILIPDSRDMGGDWGVVKSDYDNKIVDFLIETTNQNKIDTTTCLLNYTGSRVLGLVLSYCALKEYSDNNPNDEFAEEICSYTKELLKTVYEKYTTKLEDIPKGDMSRFTSADNLYLGLACLTCQNNRTDLFQIVKNKMLEASRKYYNNEKAMYKQTIEILKSMQFLDSLL